MINKQFELWPCHPKPLDDELLSCWLVRIAHANNLKVQTFCDRVFGHDRQIWNRDIDRFAPRWLINRLSTQTGTPLKVAHETALTTYRVHLYPKRRNSGVLTWILPLEIWHRKHNGYGLQFCPACLAEDEIPYFRKRWRVALYTFCTKHNAMMLDRCPSCGASVCFHRTELGRYGGAYDCLIALCHECRFDLRRSPLATPELYDEAGTLLVEVLQSFENAEGARFDAGFFKVLHQLCKIIMCMSKHNKLREYVIKSTGTKDIEFESSKTYFELRSIAERHHIVQLGMWFMCDPTSRILGSWRAKAVRYNILKRDFKRMPQWYRDIVERCSDWRNASR